MSKTDVKTKSVRHMSNCPQSSGWIDLAEDAERDIEKARARIDQLSKAARIFRQNAENGIAFPSATQN